MKKPLLTLASCVLIGASIGNAIAAERTARPLTSSITSSVAHMYQERILSGYSHTEFKVAPLMMSQSGLGIKRLVSDYKAAPFTGMPDLTIPNNVSTSYATELARKWVDLYMPGFKTRYATWLKNNGVSTGFYNYSTEVSIQTAVGTKKMAIAFNAMVDASGKATYGNPKVVEADPTILDIQYIPSTIDDDLPVEWNYAEAGSIKYRILNKLMEPITSWAVVPSNGVFDKKLTYDAATGEYVEPDTSMEACFIDSRSPGCTLSNLDVRTLLNQTATSRAIATYVDSVEPVYKDSGDGETVVPEISAQVTKRTLACKSYLNEGVYGAVLALNATQYLVEPSPNLLQGIKLQEMVTYTTTAEKTYSKQVSRDIFGGASPEGYLISPLEGSNDLISLAEAQARKDFVYIAELQSGGGVTALPLSGFSGNILVEEFPGTTSDSKQLVFGWQNYSQFASAKGEQKLFSTQFSVGSLSEITSFKLTQVNFDDFLMIKINGNVVFNGPHDINSHGAVWWNNAWAQEIMPYNTKRGGDMLQLLSGTKIDGRVCYQEEWDMKWYCNEGTRVYNSCSPIYSKEWGYKLVEGYTCYEKCSASYPVQTRTNPEGDNAGCYAAEQGTNFAERPASVPTVRPHEVDLKPYLRTGVNTMEFVLVVKGNGGFWATTEVSGCGN